MQEVLAPASTADAGTAPVPKTPRVPLPEPDTAERRNRLPLSVFVGAATGTLAFAALTTWAGAKAVSEKRSHPYDPNYDDDEVRRWARRADYFLIGTVVFAGATAATGIWWVDFRPAKRTRVALLPSRGVTLMAETRF